MLAIRAMADRPRELPFPEKFKVLFTPGVRYFAFYGGRGETKSWSVATWLILEACERRLRIVCGRQYQVSIRDSSKELLERRIFDLGLEAEFRITEQTIVHIHTGSVFVFVGLSVNPDSISTFEGADIFWIEEAASISQRVWDILIPTVRAPGSILVCCWNPNQPTDPVDVYFRGPYPPENAVFVLVGWQDNPWFEDYPMAIEKAKMERDNPSKADFIWGGGYDVSYETRVFLDVKVGRVDVPSDCAPRYGVDFGFSVDPTAIVKLYIIERPGQKSILYVVALRYGHRVPTRELPQMLDSILHSRSDLVTADGARPEIIEELCALGFNVDDAKKGKNSVREGIERLQNFEIVVDPDCLYAYDEFRGCRWPVDRLTGKVKPGENPVGRDHILDACRYATLGVNALALAEETSDYAKFMAHRGGVFRVRMFQNRRYENPYGR